MNPMQRRATALTAEQIAYVRGCQRLQLAVLKLTHNYPLSALSNKFSMAALKKAILILESQNFNSQTFHQKMAKSSPKLNSYF